MNREVFGWAVCRPEAWSGGGEPSLFTVARTRAEAVEKFLALWGPDFTWKRLYGRGWRARHVSVRPMTFNTPIREAQT